MSVVSITYFLINSSLRYSVDDLMDAVSTGAEAMRGGEQVRCRVRLQLAEHRQHREFVANRSRMGVKIELFGELQTN